MINLRDFLAIAGALLVFLISFYALTARERKTPSVVASIYSLVALVIASVLFRIIAKLTLWSLPLSSALEQLSYLLLILSVAAVLFGIWRLHNRVRNFRTDNLFKNLSIIRRLRLKWRKLKARKAYEHDVDPIPPELLQTITEFPEFEGSGIDLDSGPLENGGQEFSRSIAVISPSYVAGDELSVKIAYEFLNAGTWVQYTACSRHPAEFIEALYSHCEKKERSWSDLADRIVVVDGFTPHFGFTDSVHWEMNHHLARERRIKVITTSQSFAGIHSGAAKAFNELKQRQDGNTPRQITLVCYEGVSALADFESLDQYRIFIRHVVTSERLWGGMITLFLEDRTCEERERRLLSSYVSACLEL